MELVNKVKENIFAVLPVTLIVLLVHFLVTPLESTTLIRFLIGTVFIIIGLSIFLIGVDNTIQPVGENLGSALVRRKSLARLMGVGFIVGFLINVAEPNLFVFAGQVQDVSGGAVPAVQMLVVAAFGIGVLIALGLLRSVFQIPLRNFLLVMYGLILILAIVAPTDYIGIAFDASGSATGSITVPFILAFGLGVSSVHAGKEGEEDSFGLTAAAAGGPILAVFLMTLVLGIDGFAIGEATVDQASEELSLLAPFLSEMGKMAKDILQALGPVLIITLIAQYTLMHMPKRAFRRVLTGFVYTYVGFVLFLTGVNAGFMNAGRSLGEAVAGLPIGITMGVGALIGFVVILAEPSVHVLTAQVEEITDGAIGRNAILISLAVSAAVAVVLTVVRLMVPGLALWPFFLGGYALAVILSRFTPTLFVGLAFDSGAVASGPMTATFILAFAQGVAVYTNGATGLLDAFGVIAFVALTPPITLQIFGIIYEAKRQKQDEDDSNMPIHDIDD